MELRRFSVCLALLLVAAISQSSEGHSTYRRDTKYEDDDIFLADGTEAEQNDAENADYKEAPEEEINANILTRPTKYNVTVGRTVRLECKIDSNETVVNWRKGDVDVVVANFVPNNTEKYTFDTQTSDLIIHSLTPEDSGTYRCTVIQTASASIEHTLLVSELPKVINITASDNGRPHEGADLLLTCDVTGSPFPKIIWSKDGAEGNAQLTERDGEFGPNSVFIKKVTREHSGKYYCYAVNDMGGDTKGIVIQVRGTPRIHLHKTVVNSAVNVEATFQCSVHEEPPVKITWFKDDEVLASTSRTRISTRGARSNLTVIPESEHDFGTYTCQAECAAGTHRRAAALVRRPVLEHLEADGAKLAWTLHSHQPLLQIQLQLRNVNTDEWSMISVPLPETRTHKYEMSFMVDESHLTSGKYEAVLKAQNTHGWSDPATTLVNIAEQQPIIQGASVFQGNNAAVSRPATVVLSTLLMYLLVRML